MKKTFDMNRFGRYFSTEFSTILKDNWVTMLLIASVGLMAELTVGLFSMIFTQEWTGIPTPVRFLTFVLMLVLVVMVMPAKFYGHVTDRRKGSSYLLLPASRLEKFASMILITCVIVPLCCIAVYVGIDALIALCDRTLDGSFICSTSIIPEHFFSDGHISIDGDELPISAAIVNPFLYFDDLVTSVLVFLLGAVYFKKNKVVKTVLSCMLISFAFSVLTSILGVCFAESVADYLVTLDDAPGFILHIANHVALYDTLNDTLVNCCLLAVIWFRMKNLKH